MPSSDPLDAAEIDRLARSLREIDPSLLKAPPAGAGGARRWFQGQEPYFDAFFDTDRDGLKWFQLTLRGRSLTWDRDGGRLSTGDTHERDVDDQLYPASKVVQSHTRLDASFAALVQAILDVRRPEPIFEAAAQALHAALGGHATAPG